MTRPSSRGLRAVRHRFRAGAPSDCRASGAARLPLRLRAVLRSRAGAPSDCRASGVARLPLRLRAVCRSRASALFGLLLLCASAAGLTICAQPARAASGAASPARAASGATLPARAADAQSVSATTAGGGLSVAAAGEVVTAAGGLVAANALASPVLAAASTSELGLTDAVVLGLVEGVTEYLPVSSTGHLLVAEQALGLTETDEQKDAADAYAIVIQFGAILAVLVLYWRRFWSMLRGLAGRDKEGRRVALALIAAVIPAFVIGFLGEKYIKDYLFAIWPIVAAWIVGGIAILGVVAYDRRTGRDSNQGAALEQLTPGKALAIGLLQCVAMWPGVSRSLATILGGRLVGLSTQAAVEFSFLLGLVTLTAASGYETVKDGQMIVDTLGVVAPIVGIIVAFVSAALAVKWMVGYLNKHSLAVFGWYRIGIGVIVGILVLANVL